MATASATAPPPHALPVHWWLGFTCALLSALLFAGKAPFIRLAYQQGAGTTDLLGLRMAFSLPFFAAIAWWYAHRAGPLPAGDRLRLLALGVLSYHLSSWLDFSGLHFIDGALERVVLFLYPTIVVGWAIHCGRRGVDRNLVLALALTYGGILATWGDRIVLGAPGGTAIGVALVAASATVYAIYLILAEGLIRRVGGIRAMAVAMLGACASTIVHALLTAPHALLAPPVGVLWFAVALAIVGTVVPILLSGLAMQHLGGARTALISCVAPVATALIGWVCLGEAVGMIGWCGIAATMAGAAISAQPPRPVQGLSVAK